jgi:hypothetical protein
MPSIGLRARRTATSISCTQTRRQRFHPIDRCSESYVVAVVVWRDALKFLQPRDPPAPLATSPYHFDLKYRSRGHWRRGRPKIVFESRQLIREMAHREFSLGAHASAVSC